MTQTVDAASDLPAPRKTRIKRVWLATALCAVAACIAVTLVGIANLFLLSLFGQPFGGDTLGENANDLPILQGALAAALASAFNWYLFWLTIPAAALALALSIGRFPRRRIVHTAPYLRWGAIWGAILVAGPSIFGAVIMTGSNDTGMAWRIAGAVLNGGLIGAAAGLACAGLFLLIVRPARQVTVIDTSVF